MDEIMRAGTSGRTHGQPLELAFIFLKDLRNPYRINITKVKDVPHLRGSFAL